MNIILFYQHISRELFSIKKLAKKIEENANKAFVYSIDFELDFAYRTAKKNQIDIVVTPWMYHEENYEVFLYFIKCNPNVKIVNLHSEQIYSEFSKQILLPTRGVASDCVYHFCWGDDFKQVLLNYGIKEELIRITGNIRNDELFVTKYTREELALKYHLDTNKKWIIFAENRNFVKNESLALNKEYLCKGKTLEQLKDRANIVEKTLEITIEELNNLDKSFFETNELIYRAHPGFQGSMGISSNYIHEISELSIYEWLRHASACVVWNSTTAFESELFNVPVFVYSPMDVPDEYNTVGLGAYEQIRTIESIMNYDLEEIKNKQLSMRNYEKYYGYVDGHSVERVEKSLREIYLSEDHYKARLIPGKPHIKGYFAMIVSRYVVRFRLLDIIKFPRSAYQHKNDIPDYTKIIEQHRLERNK